MKEERKSEENYCSAKIVLASAKVLQSKNQHWKFEKSWTDWKNERWHINRYFCIDVVLVIETFRHKAVYTVYICVFVRIKLNQNLLFDVMIDQKHYLSIHHNFFCKIWQNFANICTHPPNIEAICLLVNSSFVFAKRWVHSQLILGQSEQIFQGASFRPLQTVAPQTYKLSGKRQTLWPIELS